MTARNLPASMQVFVSSMTDTVVAARQQGKSTVLTYMCAAHECIAQLNSMPFTVHHGTCRDNSLCSLHTLGTQCVVQTGSLALHAVSTARTQRACCGLLHCYSIMISVLRMLIR